MHLRAVHRHTIMESEKASSRRHPRWFCSPLIWRVNGLSRRSFARRGRGAAGMARTATRASDATEDLAVMAGAAVLGSLTIPGRPEHVREARAFVAKALGELHPALDTAVLLVSELVTNAVMHSTSRCSGGTVSTLIMES